jgi:hypothetical protein
MGGLTDDGGRAEEFVQTESAADYGSACFDYDDARVAEADAAHRVERRWTRLRLTGSRARG